MNNDHAKPSMNQEIFKLGLSVETISVYLLCCGLTDQGAVLSTKNLLGVWNGNPEALYEGIKILEERKILFKIISDLEDKSVYKLNDIKSWKP
ncbi:hypothetical protein [Desulfobacterium sp. N47]|uniref:Transcription regulator TrmB N-terminal domain-containing protein n=1 Tax=uncultured Desulfobacterium sp. TaxID=201089 RepID=E1YAA4_9BACT|nr:hypothetical protein N47_H23200 [uncultured Desulfobacterium sp.]